MTEKEQEKLFEHPSHEDLAVIAEGSGSGWLRAQVLSHIDDCECCRFVITELVKNVDEMPDFELDELDHPLTLKVVEGKSDDNFDGKSESVRPWRYPGDTFNFWISGSFILLSIIIPEFQIHLLIASAFFGLLAVIDYSHRNIFAPLINAWRVGDEEKAKEVIEKLKDRFKVS